jgi:hypothetical protein
MQRTDVVVVVCRGFMTAHPRTTETLSSQGLPAWRWFAGQSSSVPRIALGWPGLDWTGLGWVGLARLDWRLAEWWTAANQSIHPSMPVLSCQVPPPRRRAVQQSQWREREWVCKVQRHPVHPTRAGEQHRAAGGTRISQALIPVLYCTVLYCTVLYEGSDSIQRRGTKYFFIHRWTGFVPINPPRTSAGFPWLVDRGLLAISPVPARCAHSRPPASPPVS